MTSRIPDPGDPDEGVPGLQSGLPAKRITGDAQDDMIPPADAPVAADRFGTTAAELAQGESLDERLRQERDQTGHGDPDGVPYPADGGGYAPEERAMHTTENP